MPPLEPPNAIGNAKANRQYELTLGLAEDCFLGALLLMNDRTGTVRTTDPKRIELTKQVLARAMKLEEVATKEWLAVLRESAK